MNEQGPNERLIPADAVTARRYVEAFRHSERLEFERHLDLAACWSAIRKRRWLVLTTFFVVLAPVAIWVFWQKPIYRAHMLLEIQKERRDILTAQDLFAPDVVSDAYLETQYKILDSDSLVGRVMDQLGLDHLPEFVRSSWRPWRRHPLIEPDANSTQRADSCFLRLARPRVSRTGDQHTCIGLHRASRRSALGGIAEGLPITVAAVGGREAEARRIGDGAAALCAREQLSLSRNSRREQRKPGR